MPVTDELVLEVARRVLGDDSLADAEIALSCMEEATTNAAVQAVEAEEKADAAELQLSRTIAERDQAIALSRTTATPAVTVDATAAELYDTKLSLAVANGDMPQFIADKASKQLKANSLLLSRHGTSTPPIADFIGWFTGTGLGVKQGEQSGRQAIPLSRETPGETTVSKSNPLLETAQAMAGK